VGRCNCTGSGRKGWCDNRGLRMLRRIECRVLVPVCRVLLLTLRPRSLPAQMSLYSDAWFLDHASLTWFDGAGGDELPLSLEASLLPPVRHAHGVAVPTNHYPWPSYRLWVWGGECGWVRGRSALPLISRCSVVCSACEPPCSAALAGWGCAPLWVIQRHRAESVTAAVSTARQPSHHFTALEPRSVSAKWPDCGTTGACRRRSASTV